MTGDAEIGLFMKSSVKYKEDHSTGRGYRMQRLVRIMRSFAGIACSFAVGLLVPAQNLKQVSDQFVALRFVP